MYLTALLIIYIHPYEKLVQCSLSGKSDKLWIWYSLNVFHGNINVFVYVGFKQFSVCVCVCVCVCVEATVSSYLI